ncbi:hypothetical protein [Variovorax ginsengisoli]|uniref:Uncharacterized protein n=1 Tax=Variovorax ginsengisoli TaxID=363844 RepID=A0ABT9S3W6_9BURK|nr:hypothetical protein [Variovorax ginsengisoli]MDP9899038.1 hypothetical protein [Variovorax ginsengisoli]
MNFQAPRFACDGAPCPDTLARFMTRTRNHLGLSAVHTLASTNSSDGVQAHGGNDSGDFQGAPRGQFEAITEEFAEQFFMDHRGDLRARVEIVRLTQELAACSSKSQKLANEIRHIEARNAVS